MASLLLIWQKAPASGGSPTLALTITGGGSTAFVETTNRDAAITASGGGSFTETDISNRNLASTISGGGSTTIGSSRGATSGLTATGGGSVTLAVFKGGRNTFLVTGGGSIIIVGVNSSPKFATLSVTGGGGMSEYTALKNAYVYAVRSVHGTSDYEGIFHDTPRKSYRAR